MKGSGTAARKVMVVADPTRESASALQYALSHAIVESDSLILFHVESPNVWRNPFGSFFKRPYAGGGGGSSMPEMFVESCIGGEADFLYAMKQACVTTHPKVKVAVVKAEMADGKDKADVILGHCVAVQKKTLNAGYLLSSKTYKNFWLLA